MTKTEVQEALSRLPAQEQLDVIGQAWDNLAADPRNLGPITGEERELLDERIAEHEADPASALSIDETITEACRIMRGR